MVKTVWTEHRRLKRLGAITCQDQGTTQQEGWNSVLSRPRVLERGPPGTSYPTREVPVPGTQCAEIKDEVSST